MIDKTITIFKARTDEDIANTRRIFGQYAKWLEDDYNISLEFQGIDEELAGLPGKYAAPGGEILLAQNKTDNILGVIALRPFENSTCEIKRLYVLPEARGNALGKRLVSEIIQIARKAGYSRAILDTGPFMLSAQRLYGEFGFVDIPAYYDNPFPGVRYMAAELK